MNIDALEKLLEKGKDSAMLRFTLAQLYQKNTQIKKAILHLQVATTLDNHYTAAWNLLGQCYASEKHIDAARSAFLNGLKAAEHNGDKQMEKMLNVFLKRLN